MLITDPSTLSAFEQRMILENTRNRSNQCLVCHRPTALTEAVAYRLIYRGTTTRPPNISTLALVCVTDWDLGKDSNAEWAQRTGVTIHAIDGRALYA